MLNMGRSEEVGSPSPAGGRMVVVFGKVFPWVGVLSRRRLSFLLVGVIDLDFGLISGVVRLPLRTCFLSYSLVLPIVRLHLSLFSPDQCYPLLGIGISPLLGILMIGSPCGYVFLQVPSTLSCEECERGYYDLEVSQFW